MIRLTAAFATALLLAGCAPPTPLDSYHAGRALTTWYQAGSSLPAIASADLDCQIEAQQRVPARTVFRQTPQWRTPVQTQCRTDGDRTICRQVGGHSYGGEITARDANEGLRERAYGQCMARTGHSRASIPPCPPGAAPRVGARLPALSGRTCYVPAADNQSYVIGDI